MVNRITLPLADWVGAASLASAGDAQLLHRFAKAGEQQAFAMLVKRHGPMVWGVTRRLLRSHQDAEDALQATFLVLAKKAGSLRQPQLLANWLHGVAHRTALQLRNRRKILVPLEPENEPVDDTPDHLAWQECGLVIDRAIEELPSSLRIVFLLCQAEGLTTLAASKRLNLPEGTVVSRLHRARKQLQGLLARHGITSAAGAVTLGWSLALPEALSALTVRTLLASTPSALVAGLAQGVLTTMMWIKLTTAAVVVSTVGLVGAGAATFIVQGQGDKVALQTSVAQPQEKKAFQEDRIKQLEDQLSQAKVLEARLRQQMEAVLVKAKMMEDQMVQTRQVQEQQAKALVDREAMLRKQIDALEQRSQAVQKFLEQSIVAQDPNSKNKQKPEADSREAELLAKREAERLEQVKIAQEKTERRTLEQHEHRTVDLMKAKEQLLKEIAEFQRQVDTEHARWADMQRGIQIQQERLEHAQQELDRETRATEKLANPDLKKLNELKKKRDEQKEFVSMNMYPSSSNIKARVEAQLKLREKLLLEVEEKLLRMQLKLDEK